MNKHAPRGQQMLEESAKLPARSAAKLDDLPSAETIYKVAEVSRTLRCATNVVEKLVQLAAGTNDRLTLSHWLVLVRLSGTTSCKQLDLKSDTRIAPAYLTRLLDDLCREGLVRRHRSSSDRRQILLSLTERGRTTAGELLANLNDMTKPSQRDAFEQLVSALEQFVVELTGEASLLDPLSAKEGHPRCVHASQS